MSDTKHTPEPWIYDTGDGLIYDGFKSDRSICYPIEVDHDPANARRIVACVNACSDMDDPEKEIAALRAAAEKAREALKQISSGGTYTTMRAKTLGGESIPSVLRKSWYADKSDEALAALEEVLK